MCNPALNKRTLIFCSISYFLLVLKIRLKRGSSHIFLVWSLVADGVKSSQRCSARINLWSPAIYSLLQRNARFYANNTIFYAISSTAKQLILKRQNGCFFSQGQRALMFLLQTLLLDTFDTLQHYKYFFGERIRLQN